MSFARRRSPGLQFAAAVLVLAALAAIFYLPQALHGGFLSDAWSNRAIYVFNPAESFFGKVANIGELPYVSPRPLQAVYLVALNAAFGGDPHLWLVWQLVTNVGMCAAFYLLLRKLGFRALDAGVIAALLLLFPAATSTRFWLATIWAPASLGMVCLGFLLALIAFEARSTPRKLALHTVSLALFAASLLLYEVALLVMLASVLLYLLRVPWRQAVARWLADCAVLVPLTLTVTLASSEGHEETTAGVWSHGSKIFSQAVTLGATIVLPFGSDRWYVLLLIALVPAAALAAWKLRRGGAAIHAELSRWLLTMAAGALVVVLGYGIYAPGSDFYLPLSQGLGDRVNILASFGWVLMLYAAVAMIATLVLAELRRDRRWASPAAALGCVLLAIPWLSPISEFSGYYREGYEEDLRVLASIEKAIPDPRPGSTIWTFGQPVEVAGGVPLFANVWDMTFSVQLAYDDPSLQSLVAYPESEFECTPQGVNANGRYAVNGFVLPEYITPYGRTYFVDTTSGEAVRIDSRRQCLEDVDRYPLAPYLPPPAS